MARLSIQDQIKKKEEELLKLQRELEELKEKKIGPKESAEVKKIVTSIKDLITENGWDKRDAVDEIATSVLGGEYEVTIRKPRAKKADVPAE